MEGREMKGSREDGREVKKKGNRRKEAGRKGREVEGNEENRMKSFDGK